MFGDKLRKLRESNDYSMDELVELYNKKFNARLNKSTISRYENGLQEPMYSVVCNFARLFQISFDDMVENTPPEERFSGMILGCPGKTIQFLRYCRDAKAYDIAVLTGISQERIKKIEFSEVEPTAEEVEKIADALRVPRNLIEKSIIPYDLSNDFIKKLDRYLEDDDYIILELYSKLDKDDKGEIRGEMKQMLKADKYNNNTIEAQKKVG